MSKNIVLPGGDTLNLFESSYTGEQVEAILTKALRQPGRNLLINSYFVGGGSQQGGGQFPINQLGQTEYIVSGYPIDRWFMNPYNNALRLTFEPDCIVLKRRSNSSYPHIKQTMENPGWLAGKVITLSVLVKFSEQNPVFNFSIKNTTGGGSGFLNIITITSVGSDGWALCTGTAVCPESMPYLNVFFYLASNSDSTLETRVKAAKLELGPSQTLAHQDANGNWVLNGPPPDPALELLKCQWYQTVLTANQWTPIGVGRVSSSTVAYIVVPLPTPMRSNPSVSFDGDIYITGNSASKKITNMVVNSITESVITLTVTTESGLTPNEFVFMQTNAQNTKSRIILDCNL